MKMRRRNVIITLVVPLVVGLWVVLLLSLAPVVHSDRWDNVRVTGRIIDPGSGQPHAGVRIMNLWEPENADYEDFIRKRQDLAEQELAMIAEEAYQGHDTSGYCPGPNGLTTSDSDGQFTFCVNVLYGWTTWGWIFPSRSRKPPPFHGVKALLLQWPDGRQVVVDATKGEWAVVGEQDLHATLEMGTLHVPPP